MVIEREKYYNPKELVENFPILQTRGYFWLLECIRDKRLKAANTGSKKYPRYIIKGSEVQAFIKHLEG